ncbi:MAG: hypothetical protein ABI333_24070 [bacterium]
MKIMHRSVGAALITGVMVCLAGGTAMGAPAKKPPPGPATKMKILAFHTLESVGILKFQFLDKKKRPTKAPEGGTVKYSTNITKPRTGKFAMTDAKWKESEECYVYVRVPRRQKIVCPPRAYWIRIHFQAGKKRFSAFKSTKFPCLR